MGSPMLGFRFTTTATRELLVALTGVMLVAFLAGHMAGNFLIYFGPDAFNAYAHHLQALGPLLWVARIGLITAAVLHVSLSAMLYLGNRSARGGRYAVRAHMGRKAFPSRIMIFTGAGLFCFLFLHLADFTFADKEGARAILGDQNAGLYGVVWNAFADPRHAALYIAFMCVIGLHLSHALASLWVTFGLLTDKATPKADLGAQLVGAAFAAAFSSIPLYVMAKTYITGV